MASWLLDCKNCRKVFIFFDALGAGSGASNSAAHTSQFAKKVKRNEAGAEEVKSLAIVLGPVRSYLLQ